MKLFIPLVLFFSTSIVLAQKTNTQNWNLYKTTLYVENDLPSGTDNGYSAGESFSLLFSLPKKDNLFFSLLGNNNTQTDSYISFSLTNQIFTPTDITSYNLVADDRPYASWSYIDTTLHKASKDELRSLSLKIGFIGPSSAGRDFQTSYHKLMNFDEVNGWDNQLSDEFGLNLKYTQKWRYPINTFENIESLLVPFVSAELGNIAINAKTGITSKFGWNLSKDFGISSLELGSDPSILAYSQKRNQNNWGFSFNFTLAGSAIAHDIFLDGNTFKQSHSVEKENLLGHFGYGLSARYKDFTLDFMETVSSKQFKLEKHSHRVSSLVISYLF